MNLQEYQTQLKELTAKHELEKRALMREYAMANNPYKKGDVFTDHQGSIIVDGIFLCFSFDGPTSCKYSGVELKKDGTPKKNNPTRQAWLSNDITPHSSPTTTIK